MPTNRDFHGWVLLTKALHSTSSTRRRTPTLHDCLSAAECMRCDRFSTAKSMPNVYCSAAEFIEPARSPFLYQFSKSRLQPRTSDTPKTQNVNVTSISLNPDNRSNGLDRHISLSTEYVANFARIGITPQLNRSPFAISARRICRDDRSQTPCSIDKRPGFLKKPGL